MSMRARHPASASSQRLTKQKFGSRQEFVDGEGYALGDANGVQSGRIYREFDDEADDSDGMPHYIKSYWMVEDDLHGNSTTFNGKLADAKKALRHSVETGVLPITGQ